MSDKKKEIISLNPDLYSDLSITELEERLEMGCYINRCDIDGDVCVGYVDTGGGCVGYVNTCGADVDICGNDYY